MITMLIYDNMEVSWNRGTPKSSILIAFSVSIINHPFWGTPFQETSIIIHYPIATQPRVLMGEDNLIDRAIIEEACDTWVEDKIGQGSYRKLVEFIGAPNDGNGLLPYSFHVQSHYFVWEGCGKIRSRQPKGPCKFHGKDMDFYIWCVFFHRQWQLWLRQINSHQIFNMLFKASRRLRQFAHRYVGSILYTQYSRQSTLKQTLAGSPSSIIFQHMYWFVATYVSWGNFHVQLPNIKQ